MGCKLLINSATSQFLIISRIPTEDRDVDGYVKHLAIILSSNESLITALKIHKNKCNIRNKNMKILIFK